MARYQKKPVVIEAALFDGTRVGEPDGEGAVKPLTCPDWFPALVPEMQVGFDLLKLDKGAVAYYEGSLYIGTLEGAHRANPGDMIIRGIKGELYPCKPDIFAATYEAVE